MLQEIQSPILNELNEINKIIAEYTESDIPTLQKIKHYCIHQPGRKQIRPSIILLAAGALGEIDTNTRHIAAVIEMIHIATLLHDDVIDCALTRRSEPTINSKFTNSASILMGDFVFACAFKIIANIHQKDLTQLISNATIKIIEGELFQLGLVGNSMTTIKNYNYIIDAKTACLFATGLQAIGLSNSKYASALKTLGWHLGMAYQIQDDLLDLDVKNMNLNKEHGKDLQEQKMTLPTIIARRDGNASQQKIIDQIMKKTTPWQEVIPILESTGAIEKTQAIVSAHIKNTQKALTLLPENNYSQALATLTTCLPKRKN
ncbi:polyprenyl synthetase family protein [Candidatus Comchoanobacter bicostacola]|uniref:Polyprenyl synthetase family protein n=1 Tax=Candidatus Comchoanobacter bicostacola TaxID=2919598 RepID=A0ABY5DKP6_9GAMM|nr:polyprenyl synthetase family protein [Candidatus Comchoanobacter bicostacola]UTC24385.1 polyprenyl synthetase family protein [Candidatus Comchoanobacter bicostacola]